MEGEVVPRKCFGFVSDTGSSSSSSCCTIVDDITEEVVGGMLLYTATISASKEGLGSLVFCWKE